MDRKAVDPYELEIELLPLKTNKFKVLVFIESYILVPDVPERTPPEKELLELTAPRATPPLAPLTPLPPPPPRPNPPPLPPPPIPPFDSTSTADSSETNSRRRVLIPKECIFLTSFHSKCN